MGWVPFPYSHSTVFLLCINIYCIVFSAITTKVQTFESRNWNFNPALGYDFLYFSPWYHYWVFCVFFLLSILSLFLFLLIYFLISWRLHYCFFLKKERKRRKDRRKEGEHKGKEIRKREDEGRKAEITLDENKGHLYRIESEPRDNHSKN